MDNLKKHIDNSRSEFEVYSTDYTSLWKEIEYKLDSAPSNRPVLWRVAAAIILLMTSIALLISVNTNEKSGLALHEISIELAETEYYYLSQISQKMKLIEHYPEVSGEAKRELAALDSIYMELEIDLKDNIDSEEVVSAMIENYRLKLELLEGILNQIRKQGIEEDDEADEYFL